MIIGEITVRAEMTSIIEEITVMAEITSVAVVENTSNSKE